MHYKKFNGISCFDLATFRRVASAIHRELLRNLPGYHAIDWAGESRNDAFVLQHNQVNYKTGEIICPLPFPDDPRCLLALQSIKKADVSKIKEVLLTHNYFKH